MIGFSPGVADQLGHYVYALIDPRNDAVFYVGKGIGDRCFSHLTEESVSRKVSTIREIQAEGKQPRIEVIRHVLPDASTAFLIESVVIDVLGSANLTNLVRGHGTDELGWSTAEELNVRYGAPPIEIDESVLLIRVSKNFYDNISDLRLYENTRGIWVAKPIQRQTKYACAVYKGVVREVYEIAGWNLVSDTYLTRNKYADHHAEDLLRWEFFGQIAPDEIRDKFRLKSVKAYLRRGNADPLVIPRKK